MKMRDFKAAKRRDRVNWGGRWAESGEAGMEGVGAIRKWKKWGENEKSGGMKVMIAWGRGRGGGRGVRVETGAHF